MAPATDWKELIAPDEAERFQRLAENLRDLQRKNAMGKKVSRTLHAVGQAGLEAELRVLPDLPAYARVGLFATPATYRAYGRFPNAARLQQAARQPARRGIG